VARLVEMAVNRNFCFGHKYKGGKKSCADHSLLPKEKQAGRGKLSRKTADICRKISYFAVNM
jgi:hypothetical protein